MTGDHAQAWDEFWARDTRGRKGGGGCLPEGWREIDAAQRAVWHAFAKRLRRGARVLDLATGDGRVMANMLEVRRDLKPLGIDRATHLPDPPRGTKMRGGVPMDAVPQPDKSFQAVTSQFGFEYGDMERTAAEVARLVQNGGLVAIMSHRADGPILAHNLKRREQIRWAVEEQDLPGIALRSLQLRQAGIAAIPQDIISAPARGAERFGQGSAAWEIAEALRQTLHFGRRDRPDNVASLIREIVAQARNEMGRIASLEEAATAAALGERVVEVLETSGLRVTSREELRDGAAEAPFADFTVFTAPA